jgi:hypothetical protein
MAYRGLAYGARRWSLLERRRGTFPCAGPILNRQSGRTSAGCSPSNCANAGTSFATGPSSEPVCCRSQVGSPAAAPTVYLAPCSAGCRSARHGDGLPFRVRTEPLEPPVSLDESGRVDAFSCYRAAASRFGHNSLAISASNSRTCARSPMPTVPQTNWEVRGAAGSVGRTALQQGRW